MGLLDGLGAALSPGGLAEKVGLDTSGPASALSAIGDTISGGLDSVGSFLKTITGPATKLPLPNPLHAYASYDYVLGISVLTTADYNNPDTTYMTGKRQNLICKTANADPGNRVNTAYGKYDFFIDNMELDSLVGNEKGNNTNVTKMRFEITEPYSMGLFMISVQQAAREAGHPNWHGAPYLLTIQFRGNSETGSMVSVPNTNRYIPFTFTMMSSRVTAAGTVYSCDALPYNAEALNRNHATLKNDISISGKSVQEMLQTGEKSLQAALNARAKQLRDNNIVVEADEYLILFPSSTPSAPKTPGKVEVKTQATGSPKAATVEDAMLKKIGVSRDSKTGVLLQEEADCNQLGRAKMTFSITNKGDTPVGKESKVYSEKKGNIYVRGDNVIDYAESDFRFSQESDVFNAINQVLLQSQFPRHTLDPTKLSKEGYKGWWKIETQIYLKASQSNMVSVGLQPRIVVYRIVPYDVHISNVSSVNVQSPGFAELAKQAVKVFNYIYTGKNVDVLRFNIEHKASYMNYMNADGFRTQDAILVAEQSTGGNTQDIPKGLPDGEKPSTKDGVVPSQTTYSKLNNETDEKGGGGNDSLATRVARMFHDAVTKGTELQKINMDIVGDPYFIAQSGQGNYNSKPIPGKPNLNADGTINYQNGEVDILINFRSPSDINQVSGLYNIGRLGSDPNNTASSPVLGFSGLYRINRLVSQFKKGSFTQTIDALRRPGQENPNKGTKTQALNPTTPAVAGAVVELDPNKPGFNFKAASGAVNAATASAALAAGVVNRN